MVHPPRRPPGRPPLRPSRPLRHFPPPLLLLLPLLAAAGARGEPWRTSKHLHAPRAYHGCAASEDAVFVLGGEGAGGEVFGSVEKFSVADRVWLRSVDPLPTPRLTSLQVVKLPLAAPIGTPAKSIPASMRCLILPSRTFSTI